jgi:hypothetical protein
MVCAYQTQPETSASVLQRDRSIKIDTDSFAFDWTQVPALRRLIISRKQLNYIGSEAPESGEASSALVRRTTSFRPQCFDIVMTFKLVLLGRTKSLCYDAVCMNVLDVV